MSVEITTQYEGGAAMVEEPPLILEWEDSGYTERINNHRDRCFQAGGGGGEQLPRVCEDWTSVVQSRVQDAHQLPGSIGSTSGSQVFCAGPQECDSPAQDGQYECSHICEQTWGHSITESDSNNQGPVALVPAERHSSHS